MRGVAEMCFAWESESFFQSGSEIWAPNSAIAAYLMFALGLLPSMFIHVRLVLSHIGYTSIQARKAGLRRSLLSFIGHN